MGQLLDARFSQKGKTMKVAMICLVVLMVVTVAQSQDIDYGRISREEEHDPRIRLTKKEEHDPRIRLTKKEDHDPRIRLTKKEEHDPRIRLPKKEEHDPRIRLTR